VCVFTYYIYSYKIYNIIGTYFIFNDKGTLIQIFARLNLCGKTHQDVWTMVQYAYYNLHGLLSRYGIIWSNFKPLNSRDTFDESYGEIIFTFASNDLF